MAINDHIARVFFSRPDHNNGRLLARFSQGRNQLPLLARLADPQMFPALIELVKLQRHRRWHGIQYGRILDWSFAGFGEVCLKLQLNQRHRPGTGLSRCAPEVYP